MPNIFTAGVLSPVILRYFDWIYSNPSILTIENQTYLPYTDKGPYPGLVQLCSFHLAHGTVERP